MNSNSIVDADEKEHADHEKSDKSRRESRKRAYNQTRQLQDVSVPPRPKYEGDAPQEEQPSSDDENNTKTPPRDGISTIETVMKSLNILYTEQKERTAQYFKVPLRKETYKLDDMSRKCLSIQSQQDVPDKKENKKKEKLAKGEAAVRTAEYEDKDVRHDAKNDKEEDVGELEYITDITENMNERKGKIPSYTYCHQHQIGIGKSMMKQVQSFYCGCCRQLMLTEDVNAHLRSIIHYHNFVSEVESLTSNATAAETKETEQAEVKEIASERERERERESEESEKEKKRKRERARARERERERERERRERVNKGRPGRAIRPQPRK